MLTRASKCPTKILQEAAKFVLDHENFLKMNLPLCIDPMEVSKALAASDSWFVLANVQPSAVFKLEISGRIAVVSQILASNDMLPTIAAELRKEIRSLKASSLTLRVPPGEVELWAGNGFQRGLTYVKFSRAPERNNVMPLLPLTNASRKELPILSQLMYAPYSKTDESFPDVHTAEALLRATMSGVRGTYLRDASFVSGAPPNLVSACLLTVDSPGEAKIDRLFTHPLYRARGLATAEIAAAMNQLSQAGVKRLSAWNRESNEVAKRLLAKMEFTQQSTAVEMSGSL